MAIAQGVEPRIDRLQREAAARPAVVSLGGGLPAAELFPREALARAFLRAVRDPQGGALQYAWPEGREPLRRWVAARLRARGAAVEADEVVITSGAQQAIALAAQLLLGPGDAVGTGPETYPAALDVFRTRARAVATSEGARCFYAMPAIGNPRSRALDAPARAALLASGLPIIEDDAYAELRFDGRVPPPLLARSRERVWHVGTVSKTLAPGLRVGWLVPPPAWRGRALELKHAADLQSSSLGQAVLEQYLAADGFDARLEKARRFYGARARRALAAVRRHLPEWRCEPPEGGFALYLECDEPGDDTALLELATAHGASFDPGRLFRPDGSSRPLAMRLCFSAVPSPQFQEGVRRLARAWADLRGRRA